MNKSQMPQQREIFSRAQCSEFLVVFGAMHTTHVGSHVHCVLHSFLCVFLHSVPLSPKLRAPRKRAIGVPIRIHQFLETAFTKKLTIPIYNIPQQNRIPAHLQSDQAQSTRTIRRSCKNKKEFYLNSEFLLRASDSACKLNVSTRIGTDKKSELHTSRTQRCSHNELPTACSLSPSVWHFLSLMRPPLFSPRRWGKSRRAWAPSQGPRQPEGGERFVATPSAPSISRK